MSPLEECCYRCGCGRVVCRDNLPLLPEARLCDDCAVKLCGRIDRHDGHEWSRPPSLDEGETVVRWCPGEVVVAGGECVA